MSRLTHKASPMTVTRSPSEAAAEVNTERLSRHGARRAARCRRVESDREAASDDADEADEAERRRAAIWFGDSDFSDRLWLFLFFFFGDGRRGGERVLRRAGVCVCVCVCARARG